MGHALVVGAIFVTVVAISALFGNEDAKDCYKDWEKKGGGCLTAIGTAMCIFIVIFLLIGFLFS